MRTLLMTEALKMKKALLQRDSGARVRSLSCLPCAFTVPGNILFLELLIRKQFWSTLFSKHTLSTEKVSKTCGLVVKGWQGCRGVFASYLKKTTVVFVCVCITWM